MMYMVKFLLCIPIITLAQQGLFFSVSAPENKKAGESDTFSLSGGNEGEFVTEKTKHEQIRYYIEMGLIDLAVPELKRIIEAVPDAREAHAYLAWAYSQKGMVPEAVKELHKVLDMNPDLRKTTFEYPMLNNTLAVTKEFSTHFAGLIYLIDDFSPAHEVLGLCYMMQGKLGDALDEYKKVLKLSPDRGKGDRMVYGRKLVPAVDQAIREYEEVLMIQPDYTDAYIKLACARAVKGMTDQSIGDIKKALSIEPDRIEAHIYLGCFYAKKWMMDEALKELTEAKRIREHILEDLYTEVTRSIQHGMFEKAISFSRDILAVAPDNKRAYFFLATAYSKNNQTDKAIGVCKKIIHLYPDDIRAYIFLGWIYIQCNMFEEAMDTGNRAALIEPDNPELRAFTAFLSASQNQIHQAVADCIAMVHEVSAEYTMEDYGWIKGNVPSIGQKLREVTDVLRLKPDYGKGYVCLGWLYSKNGESEKAVDSYRKAIALLSDVYDSKLPSGSAGSNFPSFMSSNGENMTYHKDNSQLNEVGIMNHPGEDLCDLLSCTHVHLGNVYIQRGQIHDALNEYNRALGVLLKRTQDDSAQGLTHLEEGDIDRAIFYFNRVLKFHPGHKETYFLLADAYEKKGLYHIGKTLRLQGEKLQ
ncbi:MAG: tetratricopeptide repeat protein [wastewater metagenome]|nr:tetratricopeptide repeat protein [Candidatus Loosdrechtia aerotolerans]